MKPNVAYVHAFAKIVFIKKLISTERVYGELFIRINQWCVCVCFCCSQKYYHINIVLCTILLIEHLSLRRQGPQTGARRRCEQRWLKDHKMKLVFRK